MFEVTLVPGAVEIDFGHQYWVTGDTGREGPYSSVTRLLKTGRPWYRKEHALRGQRVHEACEFWDRLGEELVDPALMPYLDAWRSFEADMGSRLEILEIERSFVAEVRVVGDLDWWPEALGDQPRGVVLRYGGTVDRNARVDGIPGPIDLKSGYPNKWHARQLSGYAAPWASTRGHVVQLKDSGLYKVTEFEELDRVFDNWMRERLAGEAFGL